MSQQAECEWASYHIFYHGSGDRVLSRLVLPVVCDAWSRRQIAGFFFLHYGLGGPHVRLRLLCTPAHRAELDEALRKAAAELFRRWPSETHLADEEILARNRHFAMGDSASRIDSVYPDNSLVELPFQPEVERYGGPGLLAHSLDFFCVSSSYVLSLLEQYENQPRASRLSHAMLALLRQALGFTADSDELCRLVAYAALGNNPASSLLTERADREFERRREDYIALVCEEVERFHEPVAHAQLTEYLLADAARALGWCIRGASGPVRWQIVSSQLHMTLNRMGLMGAEEAYLGHILRRAIEGASGANPGLVSTLGSFATASGIPDEDRLGMLAVASLSQLTSPDLLQEVGDER